MESAIDSGLTVLITGETGTGKEMVARAIHYNSPRSAAARQLNMDQANLISAMKRLGIK